MDTPGLESSANALGYNNKVLHSIKAAQKKHKPDLVLYVDRCDTVRGFEHIFWLSRLAWADADKVLKLQLGLYD